MSAYYLPCPECAGPIDENTIYHEVEVIDPDISNQTMLAENANQVAWTARQANIPACGPSEITVTWYADNRRHDVDSISAFQKAACDGLVDAGVWPDDNPKHVAAIHLYHGYDKAEPRIEIRIDEHEGATA